MVMRNTTGSECLSTWNIDWNCNCTGKPDAVAITLTIGSNTPIEGCLIQQAGGAWTLCMPCAPVGANGDAITMQEHDAAGKPTAEPISGKLITSDGDSVFCVKDNPNTITGAA